MPEHAGLATLTTPPSALLDEACRHILAHHAAALPDLTRLTVLVPHLQAVHAVARALREVAARPVLLLPRITTLRAWADEIGLGAPTASAAVREALLYQALAAKGWFDQADLWAIAAELSGLFDELTRWHVGMSGSLADFQGRLDRAYRVRAGASFAFEARMVFELWHALARDTSRLDAEAAYQLRLGTLAERNDTDIVCIGLERLSPSERQFLERCAMRCPVASFAASTEAATASTPPEQVLARAWPERVDQPLAERARELKSALDASPLRGRLAFYGAHGIEQEALAIDLAVRQWLDSGSQAIAVIALDRLTARRARALLERSGVLVRDEAGWTFSTTSAATVVSRWFDACGNDFLYRDLLDLLKSSFVFADWERGRRQAAVWRLERMIRRESLRAGLDGFLALAAAAGDEDAGMMLEALQRGARAFDRRRRKTLGGWLTALQACLREIGVVQGLDADVAGMQLRALLDSLAAELSTHGMLLGFGEFRRWMGRQLEAATFRDVGIESPVVFTSLAATSLRRFDAALICGADERHLAGGDAPGLFFNQNVRADLGLPGRAQSVRETEAALYGLIARTPEVRVTWQRLRDGDPNLLAPTFERLRTLHALTWDDELHDERLDRAVRASRRAGVDAAGDLPETQPPAPRLAPALVPARISASGYNALMACPYQYFARYVLRLRELDDVQEDVEKSDYGNLIHEILHRFHRDHPLVAAMEPAVAAAELLAISRAVFVRPIGANYLARAWLMRWEKLVPSYLDWQGSREHEGWRFHAGELDRSVVIETPAGRRVELHGRIDRVDQRAGGAVSVLDYKTRDLSKLRDALKTPGEDVQLSVYELLWGDDVEEAAFVSLDGLRVGSASPPVDAGQLAQDVCSRIGRLFDRMAEGAALPAQGSEQACAFCDVGGLCRRRHWP